MSAERPNLHESASVPGREQFEAYEALRAEQKVPQESPEACEQKVAELESLMEDFADRYNLDLLHSIAHITAEERRTHPMRVPAREDLKKLFTLLTHLETQDAVSDETIMKLWDRYEPLDQAVGAPIEFSKNGNEFIDHTRPFSRVRSTR